MGRSFPRCAARSAKAESPGSRRCGVFAAAARAAAATLRDAWRADLDISSAPCPPDLARLDVRVRALLPAGTLAPPDLRDAALARARHAPAILGPIAFEGLLDIDPVWRPLLVRLAEHVPLSWTSAGAVDRSWFPGALEVAAPVRGEPPVAEACADPRAEVVEALRWARGLLARGDVHASEIGIASTTTQPWDEHFLALAREAGSRCAGSCVRRLSRGIPEPAQDNGAGRDRPQTRL